MRRDRRPAAKTGWRRGVLAVVAAVVVVLVVPACSDAHSQAEKDWADTGVDPRLVTFIAPPGLETFMKSLGAAFLEDHPDIRITYVADEPEKLAERVEATNTPVLWIDDAASARSFAEEPISTVPLGQESLVLVSSNKYQGQAVTFADFGGGNGPRTGLCAPELSCGESAREVLKERDVEANPDEVYDSENELIEDVVRNVVSAAILYESYAATWWVNVTRTPLPPPDDHPRLIEARTYGNDDRLSAVTDWLQSNPEVDQLIAQAALKPIAA